MLFHARGGGRMGARLASMGAAAGEAIVNACVNAVTSGVEMAMVPRVADVLGPALHVPTWRGRCVRSDSNPGSTVHLRLTADSRSDPADDSVAGWIGEDELAAVLCAMPDVCPHGHAYHMHLPRISHASPIISYVSPMRLASSHTLP